MTLSHAETAIITRRATGLAGYLTPVVFYLAAAMRAHDAAFTRRGQDPSHYLVPLPVNLRPKGIENAVFRSNISPSIMPSPGSSVVMSTATGA